MNHHDRGAFLKQCGVEVWYESVAELTPLTRFLTLSKGHISSLVNGHHAFTSSGVMEPFLSVLLEELGGSIDHVLEEFGGSAFVRLSSRSPKDAAFFVPQTSNAMRAVIQREPSKYSVLDMNGTVRLLLETSLASMQVRCARDALYLLIASPRIWMDLLVNERDGDEAKLVLRKWEACPLYREVRVFIHASRVTAIGQYVHFLVFEEIQEGRVHEKENWKSRIVEYFEKIRDFLPSPNCILDVCVFEDRIRLLEFNPWGRATAAGLFNWTTDKDLLSAADGECQVRFREQLRDNFEGITLLPAGWRDVCVAAFES